MSKDATLSLCYRLIQEIMDAITNHSYEQFIAVLEESKKYTLPKNVRTAFTTLERHSDNIKNSLLYTLPNGCVEGTNNKIKNIKRTGYGYLNFSHLRGRIILSTHQHKLNKKAIRPLLFTEEDRLRKEKKEQEKREQMKNMVA